MLASDKAIVAALVVDTTNSCAAAQREVLLKLERTSLLNCPPLVLETAA